MGIDDYNRAVDLWNDGRSLDVIADELDVSVYDLHPISRAVTREAARMSKDGEDMDAPVRLSRLPTPCQV